MAAYRNKGALGGGPAGINPCGCRPIKPLGLRIGSPWEGEGMKRVKTGAHEVMVKLDVHHVCGMTGLSPDQLKLILDRAPRGSSMFAWTRRQDGTIGLEVTEQGRRFLDEMESQC